MNRLSLLLFSALLFHGCQSDPIELNIQSESNSTVSIDLKQLSLSAFPHPDRILSIDAGYGNALYLKEEGSLYSWGANDLGQLGHQDNIDRSTPTLVVGGACWKSAAMGYFHTLALHRDGTLWAWGYNSSGELGTGDLVNRNTPTKISGLTSWRALHAGSSSSYAIKDDGTLWTWGNNSVGQLGLGTVTPFETAMRQVGSDTDWKMVRSGGAHVIALKTDGTLWAWGPNADGELGLGDNSDRHQPTQVGSDTWTDFLTGIDFTVALKSDGTLWSWGSNKNGELGQGTTDTLTSHTSAVQIGSDTDWKDLYSGSSYFAYAQKNDGTVWRWGQGYTPTPAYAADVPNNVTVTAGFNAVYFLSQEGVPFSVGNNYWGQLGLKHHQSRSIFTAISDKKNWRHIAADVFHSLGINEEGKLFGWGKNQYGQLGLNTLIDAETPTLISDLAWSDVCAGERHGMALKSDGALWAWGDNGFGQLGTGIGSQGVPTMIAGSLWRNIDCKGFSSLAIKTDGTLWAWGRNEAGQLGDGTTTNSNIPVQEALSRAWKSASIGGGWGYQAFTGALTGSGNLYMWGHNEYGKLGLNDTNETNSTSTPMPVMGTKTWSSLALGRGTAFAIDTNGSLWGWGRNDEGQLGDGSNSTRYAPVLIGTSSWLKVAAGAHNTLAIRSDGTLWGWGKAANLGLSTDTWTPIPLSSDTSWLNVKAGFNYFIAMKQDGSAYGLGENFNAQMGIGSSSTLMTTLTLLDWVKEVKNEYFSIAISFLGALWGEGLNSSGQLGIGDQSARSEKTQISNDNDWREVAIGRDFTVAIKNDGTLWGWGANTYHQLTLNNTGDELIPVQISSESSWSKVSCGDGHVVALKTDGTAWAWGDNAKGEIGNGVLSLETTVGEPTQIGSDNRWTDVLGYKDATYLQKNDGTVWGAGNLIYFGLLQP